eukprot:CAMPEP_0185582176 /NCGR_PEP_ID=MMETSP0434-20130131/20056_1 /TAXON_ID=626734 ORGANISM="Favella taraikaensis, Strain Fe Narragansett Bay" /NCGR_SAMPLE_ID=MMETSP0434 /ASSEMBLY_ACC=CAM_ASM_000379 /LENGTH=31 /DNA_ID= /DNA_START= /DNA_END= /DNA_ORIENTATION=
MNAATLTKLKVYVEMEGFTTENILKKSSAAS